MSIYRNVDVHTRVWPRLQRASGATLQLEPGEAVDLELPDDFSDQYLVPDPESPKKYRKNAPEPGADPAADVPPVSEE